LAELRRLSPENVNFVNRDGRTRRAGFLAGTDEIVPSQQQCALIAGLCRNPGHRRLP